MHKGRVVFGAMDEVVFGRPASEAIVEQMNRLGAKRAFLMVSGTLNRETDEIENIRRALGPRCVGTFDAMPPHTPRAAVIAASRAGPRRRGRPHRHHRRRLDHRRRQGGAALPRQRYPQPRRHRPDQGRSRRSAAAQPRRRCARSACRPRLPAASSPPRPASPTRRPRSRKLLRHPLLMPRAVILDPGSAAHTPEWLWLSTGIRAVDHCVEGICSREAHPYGDAQALKGLVDAGAGAAAGEGRCRRSRRADGLPDRDLAFDRAAGFRRADGRQPRHRLRARRRVRRAARLHLLRDAAVGDALEQIGQCRAAGAGRGRDGASGRGRRRRARRLHSRPRHAAQPARGQGWPRAFRPHRASRRWRRPGCRATRARSRDRRRCAKFWIWPRKEIEANMYTGKHAHLRPLQPAFIMACIRRGGDLSRAGGAQQPAGASVSQPRPEAARSLFDLHGEQQPLSRSLRRRRTARASITPA